MTSLEPKNVATVRGVVINATAKITGITPAGLTFSGKCVDWPPGTPVGMGVYAALIIAFTYFYAFVQVNPEQMADNLKKQGGYIPGVRPGKMTQDRINPR